MRRAFVGFSTPMGYSYRNPARLSPNDASSSPNPVLFGSMGLFILYDEIWFACESLCPNSMRGLPYVRYLDVHGPKIDLAAVGFRDEIERIYNSIDPKPPGTLNDMFGEGYGEGMTAYLGAQLGTDNHTHDLKFLGENLGGNPGLRELIYDIWLISRYKNLQFDLTLNPLTARLGMGNLVLDGLAKAKQLGLAERVLTFGSLYDITGPGGPYHPCLEEIRDDDLLRSFREWMDRQRTRLDNQDLAEVETEVNAKVEAFTDSTLRKAVAPKSLAGVVVKVAKDELIGKIPGGSVISTVGDSVAHNKHADTNQWKVFIALTQKSLKRARFSDVRRV